LDNEQIATVWQPMLQCIKSRRRNSKAKVLRENNKQDLNNSNNNSNHNDSKYHVQLKEYICQFSITDNGDALGNGENHQA